MKSAENLCRVLTRTILGTSLNGGHVLSSSPKKALLGLEIVILQGISRIIVAQRGIRNRQMLILLKVLTDCCILLVDRLICEHR